MNVLSFEAFECMLNWLTLVIIKQNSNDFLYILTLSMMFYNQLKVGFMHSLSRITKGENSLPVLMPKFAKNTHGYLGQKSDSDLWCRNTSSF